VGIRSTTNRHDTRISKNHDFDIDVVQRDLVSWPAVDCGKERSRLMLAWTGPTGAGEIGKQGCWFRNGAGASPEPDSFRSEATGGTGVLLLEPAGAVTPWDYPPRSAGDGGGTPSGGLGGRSSWSAKPVAFNLFA
jgi:hypothetical protein